MNFIAEITDEDFGFEFPDIYDRQCLFRRGVRAVILNEKQEIGIFRFGLYDAYKLPGGGVEEGESIEEALHRECLEEMGAEIEILEPIGYITEVRRFPDSDHGLVQSNQCYLAELKSLDGTKKDFSEKEKSKQAEDLWLPIPELISRMEAAEFSDYEPNFYQLRDLLFVKNAQEIIARRSK